MKLDSYFSNRLVFHSSALEDKASEAEGRNFLFFAEIDDEKSAVPKLVQIRVDTSKPEERNAKCKQGGKFHTTW